MITLGWLVGSAISIIAAVLFIPRELWKRWRVRIVDRLDIALRRKVSRFDRRYREFMLSSLRFIDIKGLATVGYFTPELDAVFVDVSLAYRAPHEIPEGLLSHISADVTDRHSITEFLDLPDPMVLAVVGVPGSGKTTLLRYTARKLAQSRRRVPILLYLRDHVTKIIETPDVALPVLVPRPAVPEPPGWFEQRLRDGDCVVLLDGLDEVARADDRRAVATWVETQTKRYPRNRFVITSRPQGYRSAPVEGAIVLQVRGLTDDQIARFIRTWYLAAERHSTGIAGEDVRLRADAAADELLDRLNGAPNLYDLTVNPLLLTMIANVHRYRSALPGSRADLYGEICQVMLWRRQEAKNLPVELSGDKKETLLRGLAYTMMQRRVRDLPREDLLAELKPLLRRMSTRLSEVDFLTDVSSNGLLIERESGQYSFAHLTFQEYLAAAHIRDRNLVKTLADAVNDPWWREATLLYCARSDADPIVQACLDSGTVTALSLAFDCVAQRSELAPEIGERLTRVLDAPGHDPARQLLRTGVLVARNLRDMVRTATGARVCAQPVSWEVYLCYLAEHQVPEPDGRYISPREPVAGVRRSEVRGFVDWVNWITADDPGYRLPTRAEIEDRSVQRVLARMPWLSVWLEPGSDTAEPIIWIPVSTYRYRVLRERFVRRLVTDFERWVATFGHVLTMHSIVAIKAIALASDPGGDLSDIAIIEHARAGNIPYVIDTSRLGPRVRDWTFQTDGVFDRILALDYALGLARALERVQEIFRMVGTTRAEARQAALNRMNDADLNHAVDFARGIAPAFNPFASPTPSQIVNSLADTPIMGTALQSLVHLTRRRPDLSDRAWAGRCAQTLLEDADFPLSVDVSIDDLATYVGNVPDWVRTRLAEDQNSWSYQVAVRLNGIAQPVFDRQAPLTPELASAIRIAALCLAAEASKVGPVVGGDGNFLEIAAGVTLLEERQSNEALVTETIMLAMV